MGEMKNAHTFFVGSPYGKISTWETVREDNIKMYLKETGFDGMD
jgi:hypothetical protein